MTDKQIIIDGVDVAKCRCFTSEWDFNNCGHICKGTECKYKRLWYKKQLKRKEQECEELKHEVELMMDCSSCKVDECKKTLAEIKEIAEENIRIADLEGLNGVYRRGLAEQILQKISECEVENDR